ncbi:Oxalate/formate antiporter [Granulibacter bethesdensis]|nr:Oxalate/formate antiporter [Granulibacter bethesdensis]
MLGSLSIMSGTALQPSGSRWLQLALGVVCMVMIANLQYGWTLFVLPIDKAHHWGRAAIQVAFTVFVLTETWLVPIEGWLVDRYGPRLAVLAGGVLIAASWAIDSMADSLTVLYTAAAIGGVGCGLVYGATVGNALKWFPDKRGLASGITAAGFGAGSAVTIVPISSWIASHGYESAFLTFGLGQGIIVMIASMFLVAPQKAPSAIDTGRPTGELEGKTPAQTLRHPVFWLLYLMFVLVCTGGLMATAQIAVIARDYGVDQMPVTLLGLTLPALTFALSLDRVLNGLTRPFFGWVSDRIGRELTMFIAFGIEAVGIFALLHYAHSPVAFVIVTGLVFFAWGEIYSLFPATCTDTFGRRYATTNYGMLYTAKGTSALLVPVSSIITAHTGNWEAVFYVAAASNALAAILALFVLKPLRHANIRAMEENGLSLSPVSYD